MTDTSLDGVPFEWVQAVVRMGDLMVHIYSLNDDTKPGVYNQIIRDAQYIIEQVEHIKEHGVSAPPYWLDRADADRPKLTNQDIQEG